MVRSEKWLINFSEDIPDIPDTTNTRSRIKKTVRACVHFQDQKKWWALINK